MGRARGSTNTATAVSRRGPDPFTALMGAGRGGATATVLYSLTMTAEARGAAEHALDAARAGDLSPAFDLLAGRWSEHPPPAQALLQQHLSEATWEGVLDAPTIARWRQLLGAADIIPTWQPLALPAPADLAELLRTTLTKAGAIPDRRLSAALVDLHRAQFISAIAQVAASNGETLIASCSNLSGRSDLDEYQDEVPVSNRELAALIGADTYAAIFAKLLPDPEASGMGEIFGPFRRELLEAVVSFYRRHYRKELKAARAARTATLSRHPAVGASTLVRDRMAALNLSAEDVQARSGLTLSVVKKMMMRSIRPRSRYNSGRIAALATTRAICDTLDIDWAIVQLATLTVELPGASRRNNGHLHKTRYDVIRECVERLRTTGTPAALLDAIQAQADGRVIIAANPAGTAWQEPYRQLIARERARLNLA